MCCLLPCLVTELSPGEPCSEPHPTRHSPPVLQGTPTLSPLWDVVSWDEPVQSKKGEFWGADGFEKLCRAEGEISPLPTSTSSIPSGEQSVLSSHAHGWHTSDVRPCTRQRAQRSEAGRTMEKITPKEVRAAQEEDPGAEAASGIPGAAVPGCSVCRGAATKEPPEEEGVHGGVGSSCSGLQRSVGVWHLQRKAGTVCYLSVPWHSCALNHTAPTPCLVTRWAAAVSGRYAISGISTWEIRALQRGEASQVFKAGIV